MADDDESVVPLSAQPSRPLDTALRQQRINAWYPILDPWWVIATLCVLGAIFVPAGFKMQSMSNGEVELIRQYDSASNPDADCGIATANANRSCTIQFVIPKNLTPPILVHYQIENFYQNHRKYIKSRDIYQLAGALTIDSLSEEDCKPLVKLGNLKINPCGVIANTMFNDVISLTSGTSSEGNFPLAMLETGIAWQSDLDYKFKQPEGFNYGECPGDCDATCCEGDEWSCTDPYSDPSDGKCYRYFYPEDETTHYLYESYPMLISPLEGVTNEHFVVWMRIAALPKFRKLYGWINQPIAAGQVLEFQIQNNWEVKSFGGTKSLVLSTNSVFGGRNAFLGPYFYGVGLFCFGAAFFFAAKQVFRPRKVGDRKYLQLKED